MNKIAVITARGGSKRIPRKNIRLFCGKPIIAYSIQAAIDSQLFDEVMVSTDDDEIASLSKEYGAKVPFFRSKECSSDVAITADVLSEVLVSYNKLGIVPDYICCIYPTAPFVTPSILQDAFNLLLERKASAVNPVARYSYPIQRALYLREGVISMREPEHIVTLSQDLEPCFHDAGQFYWFNVVDFKKRPTLLGPNTVGLELPEWKVQDIDHENDWVQAEMKYQFINK